MDDVEKELDVYVEHMEGYINALKVEIKNRIALISVLKQAETQLESDRKDVKTVAHVSIKNISTNSVLLNVMSIRRIKPMVRE